MPTFQLFAKESPSESLIQWGRNWHCWLMVFTPALRLVFGQK